MSTSLLIVGMYSRVLRRLLTGQATTTLLADTHRSPLKQGIGLHEVMNKLLEPDLIRTLQLLQEMPLLWSCCSGGIHSVSGNGKFLRFAC